MKRFLPSLVFIFFSVTVSLAQSPKGINYQGVARNNEGNPLASTAISVRISILKNSATGDVEYAETHKPQTNQFGLFTLVIGQGTKVTGDFAFISWAIGSKWLQIEIDPKGGSAYTLAGTQQLMTVPYAFYAEYSGNSSGLAAGSGIAINSGVVSNTGDADSDSNNELQNLSEVLIKSNNAGGVKITNLGAPVAGTDAATKNYVDAQNALQNLSGILTVGNDASAKQIKNLGAPTDPNDATTKNYVDTKFASDLDIDPTNEIQDISQVLTKGNDAGGKKITNIGAPTVATDAATKSYVDTQNALDLDQDPTNELQTIGQVLTKGNDAGGKKITNIGAPTVATDAATKSYVDTQNALDLDQDPTNELQNIGQVLTKGNDAGTKTITNLGAPVTNTDATTKLYVDNAIATNYAFKVPYSFTNTTGSSLVNQVVSFGADTYDDFNVTNSDRFVAPSSGYYMFFIDGTVTGSVNNIVFSIRVNSATVYPAKKSEERIGSTIFTNHILNLMLKLSQNDVVELVITSNTINDNVLGTLFGYKL